MKVRDAFRRQLDEVEQEINEEKIDPRMTSARISHDPLYKRHFLTVPREHKNLLDRKADLIHTISTLDKSIEIASYVNTESMAEGVITGEMKMNENLTDIVGDPVSMADAGTSNQPNIGQKNLLSVDDFFSRPISIYDTSITLGSPLSLQLAVWDLYSKSPSIRAKFRNYAFFRGDLHLRIAITGTPFHYGKALISYQAYGPQNDNLAAHAANLLIEPVTWRPALLNYLSQAPGSTTIDFRGNRPVEVICPFISPKGAHRLFNTSAAALAAATSFQDFYDAGDLWIYSINNPDAVNASATNVSLHIYAWMENVQLGPPTATQMAITTESGDERKTGPVQRFSTAAATVSSALSVIPEISVFAKASSMVFTGIASVAAWFGWSRPNVLDEPKFVKNRPYASTSNTIGSETVEKIVLDPLQELSVDPRICGTSEDEMSIAFLSSVSSYLDTVTWAPDSTILSTALWSSKVTPQLNTMVAQVAYNAYQPTAMSFASIPFEYWRGTIKFRLEIACSQFHRGKLAIGWEPNILQQPLFDTQYFLNKNYVKIIDIQETQDVEFCVHYASPYIWLEKEDPTPDTTHGATFLPTNANCNNGFIFIVPFTELQAPIDKDAFINVYVSGEDMQYNRYSNVGLPTKRQIFTESAEERADPEIMYTCLDLNATSGSSIGTSDVCFGEQPMSFRSLLKRYVRYMTANGTVTGSNPNVLTVKRPIFPGVSPTYETVPSTVSFPTFFQSLLYAYLGIKGGMRRRLRAGFSSGVDEGQHAIHVKLLTKEATAAAEAFTGNFSVGPAIINELGAATFIPHTNQGVEVELPYYSPNLFHFAFNAALIGTTDVNEMFVYWMKNYTVEFEHAAVSGNYTFIEEIATAEDFSLMRFNGAPYFTSA
jgi:hypothetical protein